MSYNNIFEQALRFFDNGDFEKAETLARQISLTSPNNPEILNLLGLIAQAKGLHSEACSLFAAALRTKPDTASYCFNLAFSYKALKQYNEALVLFNKVLSLAPTIKETHNEIACIYESLDQLDNARFHWQQALLSDPSYLTAKANLANSYRKDNPQKALAELKHLNTQHPNEPLILYNLAWLDLDNCNYSAAIQTARQVVQILPDNDAAYYLLGICQLQNNNEDAAFEAFCHCEKLNPLHFDAKLCLADIYSRKGNYPQAETRYLSLIEQNPKHYGVHNNYGEMLSKQNRLPEALEEYRKAVILAPTCPEVSNNLGALLRDIGEYEEALGLFFNALAYNNNLETASINIWETIVLLASKSPDKALKIAQNWQKTYPTNQFATYALSALKGETVENNQNFNEILFDNFADNYEVVMQNLAYSAPLAISRIAGRLEGRIVDLGCGSGLVGMVIKKTSNYLIGVDISANMIAKAKEKNIYDELIKSDIYTFLHNRTDFDWIIAADVLCYFGNLEQFLSLCGNKKLIFTIETTNTEDYQIQINGRYKHNPKYIKQLLKNLGRNNITTQSLTLRKENGTEVAGTIFYIV